MAFSQGLDRSSDTAGVSRGRPGKRGRIVLAAIGAVLAGLIGWLVVFLNQTTAEHSSDVPGFTPVRDDALAARFAPRVAPGDYEAPEELLYRMSRAEDGSIHIAYFFVWPFEENPGEGWGPWLSRNIYTGGLGLQGVLFGPGDVEVIELKLSASEERRPQRLTFETARDYNPAAFAVQHQTVVLPDDLESVGDAERLQTLLAGPPVLRVLSWNHMFELLVEPELAINGPGLRREASEEGQAAAALTPEYFEEARWEYFEMFKQRETRLSRNRAHPTFAREAAVVGTGR